MGKHHGPYAEPGRSAVVVEEKILDMLGSDAEALIADVRRDPEKNRTHPAKLRRELAEAILSDKAARPTDAGGSTAGPSSGHGATQASGSKPSVTASQTTPEAEETAHGPSNPTITSRDTIVARAVFLFFEGRQEEARSLLHNNSIDATPIFQEQEAPAPAPMENLPAAPVVSRPPDQYGYWDRDGLDFWNDRHGSAETGRQGWIDHPERQMFIVVAIVFSLVLCDDFYWKLLKPDIVDKTAYIVLVRDCQSGKTLAQIVLVYLAALCYGHAGFVSLRSGNGARNDYAKFDADAVLKWNKTVAAFLVDRYPDRFPCMDSPALEPYLLHHCNLWSDRDCKSERANNALSHKYPFVYTRLGTVSNLRNSIRKEIRLMAHHYGCYPDGQLKMTYIEDECHQRTGNDTARPGALQQAESASHGNLYDISHDLLESQYGFELGKLLHRSSGNTVEAQALSVMLKHMYHGDLRRLADDLASEKLDSRGTLMDSIRSQVRVSATAMSELFSGAHGRKCFILEMSVTRDHYSLNHSVPGLDPSKRIPVEYMTEPRLISNIEDDNYDEALRPVPDALQCFAVDELLVEFRRSGFSHTVLHLRPGRNSNGPLCDVVLWLPRALRALAPDAVADGQAVIAITVYAYTKASDLPGGPVMAFSREGFSVAERLQEAAGYTLMDANPRQRFFNGLRYAGTDGRWRYAVDKYGTLIQKGTFLTNVAGDAQQMPPAARAIQFTRGCPLPVMLAVLHRAVELAGFSKDKVNIISVGNNMLEVGCTPKTLDHMMGATLGLVCGSKKALLNIDHGSGAQKVGRINGTRGCAYWERSGVDVPRCVVHGAIRMNLHGGDCLQRHVYDIYSTPGNESTDAEPSSDDEDLSSSPGSSASSRQEARNQARRVKKLRTSDIAGYGNCPDDLKLVKHGQAGPMGLRGLLDAVRENSSQGGADAPHSLPAGMTRQLTRHSSLEPAQFVAAVWTQASFHNKYHRVLRSVIRHRLEYVDDNVMPVEVLTNAAQAAGMAAPTTVLRNFEVGTGSGNHGYYRQPLVKRVNAAGQPDAQGSHISLMPMFAEAAAAHGLTLQNLV